MNTLGIPGASRANVVAYGNPAGASQSFEALWLMRASLLYTPILLFDSEMENNAAMRWAWSLKSCLGDDRNGEDNHYSAGDACPDFLCVGAQKSGTSWLYRQLDLHPDFWIPPLKELHYFDELSRIPTVASAR